MKPFFLNSELLNTSVHRLQPFLPYSQNAWYLNYQITHRQRLFKSFSYHFMPWVQRLWPTGFRIVTVAHKYTPPISDLGSTCWLHIPASVLDTWHTPRMFLLQKVSMRLEKTMPISLFTRKTHSKNLCVDSAVGAWPELDHMVLKDIWMCNSRIWLLKNELDLLVCDIKQRLCNQLLLLECEFLWY